MGRGKGSGNLGCRRSFCPFLAVIERKGPLCADRGNGNSRVSRDVVRWKTWNESACRRRRSATKPPPARGVAYSFGTVVPADSTTIMDPLPWQGAISFAKGCLFGESQARRVGKRARSGNCQGAHMWLSFRLGRVAVRQRQPCQFKSRACWGRPLVIVGPWPVTRRAEKV